MTTRYPLTDNEEIDKLINLFKSMGISAWHVSSISQPIVTDIDVIATYKNLLIFVECPGRDISGKKIRDAIEKLSALKNNLNSTLQAIERNHRDIFNDEKFSEIKDLFRTNSHASIVTKKVIFTTEKKEKIGDENIRLIRDRDVYLIDFTLYNIFNTIVNSIREYAKYDLFVFLDLRPTNINEPAPTIGTSIKVRLLSESSFNGRVIAYAFNTEIPPISLLKISHVKRLYDWTTEGFERILIRSKLDNIRKYIRDNLPLRYDFFPNNIILATTFSKINSQINSNQREGEETLSFSNSFDIFIVIDGQHRLFSFAVEDSEIQTLGRNWKMPVIIIVFDDRELSKEEIERKMAKLYYDVNSTYTPIASEDEIDLNSKINKDSPEAKSNEIISYLNENSSLLKHKIKTGPFEEEYYGRKLLKRVSLIRYGGLLKIFKQRSKVYKRYHRLYQLFYNNSYDNQDNQYLDFVKKLLNIYFNIVSETLRNVFPNNYSEMINDTQLTDYYFMTVTNIAALINLLYYFITKETEIDRFFRGSTDFNSLKTLLKNYLKPKLELIFDQFNYSKSTWEAEKYTSSQWNKLLNKMTSVLENGLEMNE